jgi:hypothetical protein
VWLTVLQKSPLYHLYEINVGLSRLHPILPFLEDIQDDPSNRTENTSPENTPESDILASRQHTMMWNEEDCLNKSALGMGNLRRELTTMMQEHPNQDYTSQPRALSIKLQLRCQRKKQHGIYYDNQ